VNKRSELASWLKTLVLSFVAASALWTVPALAAGTTPLSLVQQIDISGQPLANCQISFFVAGTVAAPQNSYADFGLTQQQPSPLVCDQTGRVPLHWLADGLIHVRLTDASGNVIIDTTMQVLGPSSGGGGGGGGTVDPTAIFSTGSLLARYGTGAFAGFVRTNGLTIGNSTSGASERANADTQNLFVYLWNTDPNLVVAGGRGANALADFNGGKTITLPDYRGTMLAGLADMGNLATPVLTSAYCGTAPTVLGAFCGSQSHTDALAELPNITSIGNNTINVSGSNSFSASGNNNISVTSSGPVTNGPFIVAQQFSSGTQIEVGNSQNTVTSSGVQNIGVSGSVAINSSGSNPISVTSQGTAGNPFSILPPMKLATIYIRL
jgi:hypothetical protein